uniref:Protein phosphatase, Mg2+/Mn2+ dependent 1F n=1 Tax=Monodelphis domestica TaxID=13616 RepID=F7FHG8_MONDO
MTSAAPKDAQAAAQDFLDSFLGEFPGPPSPEAPLPWKAPGAPVSQEEAEGELIELALSLLCGRNAPLPLACSLTREAVTRLMQEADLSAFRQAPREERGVQEEEGEEDDGISVALLDAKSLQRCFFRGLWEVCSQWQKQMPAPSTCASRPWMTSIHAIRNTRRKMEDRHVSLPAFNELFGLCDQVDRAYFAVFDGHGGVDAANYAAIHVHVNIARHLEVTRNPAEALRAGFKKTDEMFLQKARRERAQRPPPSGIPPAVRPLSPGRLGASPLLAGSSGALWPGRSPGADAEPPSVSSQDERERIEALGGFVSYMDCWRVNGTLAVSRAIGDVFQKPYVSGEADVASHELSGTEDYLLLACDGFFDSVSREEVAGLVHGLLLGSEGSGLRLAEELVAAARQRGSRDNITVLVVFLRDPRELLRDGPPGAAGAQQDPSVAGSASACFGS